MFPSLCFPPSLCIRASSDLEEIYVVAHATYYVCAFCTSLARGTTNKTKIFNNADLHTTCGVMEMHGNAIEEAQNGMPGSPNAAQKSKSTRSKNVAKEFVEPFWGLGAGCEQGAFIMYY